MLTGVTAVSATRAWAVGLYCPAAACSFAATKALILRWDGKTWTRLPGPAGSNELLSVSADSATDAWAVGAACRTGCTVDASLTLHWNGKKWATVPSPGTASPANILDSVSSRSPRVAWAADDTEATAAMLRWNGKKWAKVALPAAAGAAAISGVSTLSATNAWAVGSCVSCQGTSGISEMFAMRRNGHAWAEALNPVFATENNALSAVAARSATDVWGVGSICEAFCGQGTEVDPLLIMHWRGLKNDRALPAPDAGGHRQNLFGVAADSATDAWAVGFTCTAGCGTSSPVLGSLILHWDGTSWTVS